MINLPINESIKKWKAKYYLVVNLKFPLALIMYVEPFENSLTSFVAMMNTEQVFHKNLSRTCK